jgi:uncharacterized BrkB/YihY/UPF0761 family membrane protein
MPKTKAPGAPVALHMLSCDRAVNMVVSDDDAVVLLVVLPAAAALPAVVAGACTMQELFAAALHSPSSLHSRAGRLPVLPCGLDLMAFCTWLHSAALRFWPTHVVKNCSATAVLFVTVCCDTAKMFIVRMHVLQFAQGVGLHWPCTAQQ